MQEEPNREPNNEEEDVKLWRERVAFENNLQESELPIMCPFCGSKDLILCLCKWTSYHPPTKGQHELEVVPEDLIQSQCCECSKCLWT